MTFSIGLPISGNTIDGQSKKKVSHFSKVDLEYGKGRLVQSGCKRHILMFILKYYFYKLWIKLSLSLYQHSLV